VIKFREIVTNENEIDAGYTNENEIDAGYKMKTIDMWNMELHLVEHIVIKIIL